MTQQGTPTPPTGRTAPKPSALDAFKASPSAETADAIREEYPLEDPDKMAALLEAVGPEVYNRYVHSDWSEG